MTWSPLARGYALAWTANNKATCRCGTRADEWEADENAYISAHWTCPGCARLAEHAESNLDKVGDKVLPGQHTYLQRRETYMAELEARHRPPPAD